MRAIPTATPTTGYSISGHTLGHGLSESKCKEQTIVFDTSAEGSDSLPGPAELLCTAFAACLLKNVERFGGILSFRYESASVEVMAWRQDSPARFTRIEYKLRVATDESDHRLELLHANLRKFGTIYNTLAAACEVDGQLTRDA